MGRQGVTEFDVAIIVASYLDIVRSSRWTLTAALELWLQAASVLHADGDLCSIGRPSWRFGLVYVTQNSSFAAPVDINDP
jgi:hypothetical protein